MSTLSIVACIVVGAFVYFNLSYYFTMSWKNTIGADKYNFFQKFQLGPDKMLNAEPTHEHKDWREITVVISYIIWPFCVAIVLLSWTIYFVFCGGFFKLSKKNKG